MRRRMEGRKYDKNRKNTQRNEVRKSKKYGNEEKEKYKDKNKCKGSR
jgi:hypothetical protein